MVVQRQPDVTAGPGVSRRTALRLGVGVFASAGLGWTTAGCAGGAGDGPTHAETVTLRWWDYLLEPVRQAGVRAMIASIEASLPQVRIERRVLPFNDLAAAINQGVAQGDLPDIAIVDNPTVGPLAAKGALADLSPKVQAWGQAGQYYGGPWASCQFDGRTVAVPNNVNCLCLYYNVELLAQAGVEPPSTWAELAAAARRLTSGSVKGLALSGAKGEEGVFQFLPFLWQTGGDLDTFATDGAEALTFLTDLVKAGAISVDCLNWTQQDANTQFLSGRAAMQVNGPWQLPTLSGQSAIRWSTVPLPTGRTAATALGGENWVVFAGGQVDLAWQTVVRGQQPDILVPFLTAMGVLPARKDMLDQGPWADDATMQLFLKQMDLARPRAFGANYELVSGAVSAAEHAAFSGASTPAEAAQTAAAIISANVTKTK